MHATVPNRTQNISMLISLFKHDKALLKTSRIQYNQERNGIIILRVQIPNLKIESPRDLMLIYAYGIDLLLSPAEC